MNLDKILGGIYGESCRLHDEGRDAEAIFTAEQMSVQSLNTLGLAYCGYMKRYDKALACFYDALKIDPGNWLLWSNITHVYSVQEKHREALHSVYKSIQCSHGLHFDPYYNAGVVLTSLGEIAEAESMYRGALEVKPDDPQTNYNLGLVLLRQRMCEEGWEKYEYRFQTSELTGNFKKRFIQDQWDGRKFKKKTLVVYSEQGLGDFLMFARFLPMVKALGGKVILEVQEQLAPLVSKNLKVDEIVTRPNTTNWPKAPKSDYAISICSLPRVLKIHSEDQLRSRPYIFAPKRPAPRGFSKKLKIGLCWAGNSDHQRDHTRSMFLEQLRPLDLPNVQLFGLLKGVNNQRAWPQGVVDLNQGIEEFPMTNLANSITDFGDLAHYVEHLDLVITVDSAVAHLCGAMGKPVWMLVGRETDFRWKDNTQSSPWYRTMRIFRFKNSWENLMTEVVDEVKKLPS